jgi:hypothetical protein
MFTELYRFLLEPSILVHMEVRRDKESMRLINEGIKLFPNNKTLKENLEAFNV